MSTSPKGIDWEKAKQSYLTPNADGTLKSYADIATEFEVSETMVEKMGKKYDWVKVRETLGKKETETLIKTREENIVDAENRHLKIWKGLQGTALNLLNNFRQKKQEDKSANELNSITSVLKTAVAGERVVLGLPNDVSKADITNINKNVELSPDEIEEYDRVFNQNEPTNNPTAQGAE